MYLTYTLLDIVINYPARGANTRYLSTSKFRQTEIKFSDNEKITIATGLVVRYQPGRYTYIIILIVRMLQYNKTLY